jgi:hypothetical protein
MTDKQGERNQSRPEKRPYHPPQLYVYGDINKLTRAKDLTGNPDGRVLFGFIRLRS